MVVEIRGNSAQQLTGQLCVLGLHNEHVSIICCAFHSGSWALLHVGHYANQLPPHSNCILCIAFFKTLRVLGSFPTCLFITQRQGAPTKQNKSSNAAMRLWRYAICEKSHVSLLCSIQDNSQSFVGQPLTLHSIQHLFKHAELEIPEGATPMK